MKIIDFGIHFGIILGAFGIIFPSFFGIVFLMLFGKPIFRFLSQNARFWDPAAAQLAPKWRPKSTKWHQKGPPFSKTRSPREGPRINPFPGSLSKRSRAPFWLILDGF